MAKITLDANLDTADYSIENLSGTQRVNIAGSSADMGPPTDIDLALYPGATSSVKIGVIGETTLDFFTHIITVAGLADNIDLCLTPKGTGAINASSSLICSVTDPVDLQDAATKNYVDTEIQVLVDEGHISNVVEDLTPSLGASLDMNGFDLTEAGLIQLRFVSDLSAVNYVTIEHEATGSGPIIATSGDDANIDLLLNAKGTGNVTISGLKYPIADGTVNQILQTDGVGNLSFVTGTGLIDQNIWETMSSDAGSVSANTTTDTFTIAGGTNISTAISGDTLTITSSATTAQNLWETITSDSGSVAANTTTDTLSILGTGTNATSVSGDTLTITGNVVGDVTPSLGGPLDINSQLFTEGGGNVLDFVGSSLNVNYLQIWGANSGAEPSLRVAGTDANISLVLKSKGAGLISLEDDTRVLGDLYMGNSSLYIDKGSDIASAGAMAIPSDGNYFDVTGTTTITSMTHLYGQGGWSWTLKFEGILTLTHNATSLILPGGVNITTAVGDVATFCFDDDASNIRCLHYLRADGTALVGSAADQNLWETIAGDSGSTAASGTTETLTIAGGTDITTAMSGNTLTVNADVALLRNVSEDTTPDLGGPLNQNGQQITNQQGGDLTAAVTMTMGTDGNYFDVSGTSSITGITTTGVIGTVVYLHFDSAASLIHHASNLIIPGGVNLTSLTGSDVIIMEYASAQYRVISATKGDGTPIVSSGLENVVEDTTPQLGGDLDVLAQKITTSTVNGDILIDVNAGGTGDFVVDVEGTTGQFHVDFGGVAALRIGNSSGDLSISNPTSDIRFDTAVDMYQDFSILTKQIHMGNLAAGSVLNIGAVDIHDNAGTLEIDKSTTIQGTLTIEPASGGTTATVNLSDGTNVIGSTLNQIVTTTDATPDVLQSNAVDGIGIASGEAAMFFIQLSGKRTDVAGDVSSYELRGTIMNDAGTTAMKGFTKTVVYEDGATDATVVANDTTDKLDITVTGVAGQTYSWKAVVQIQFV